jgi:alpha-ketoglutarate-dependent taurine dioxygenase
MKCEKEAAVTEMIKCLHVGVDIDENLAALKGSGALTLAREFGAVLIRGLADLSPARCQQVLAGVCGGRWYLGDQVQTARKQLAENIYTASVYDQAFEIPLHHEGIQKKPFPGILYFACELPATSGGATRLVQVRHVVSSLSEFAKDRLWECGIVYKQAYGFAGCREWASAFKIDSRSELEGFFRSHNMHWEWHSGDRLSVTYRRPAFMRHPADGAVSLTNNAIHYVINGSPSDLLSRPATETSPPPADVAIGDHSTTARILTELDAAYQASTYRIQWSAGDLLVVDNILVAHGRDSFKGDRKLHFASSHPVVLIDRHQDGGIADTQYAD